MRALPDPVVADRPTALVGRPWPDYALLDSGGGRKLERYGAYRIVRPEPQCLWSPAMGEDDWSGAHATFEAGAEEETGRWRTGAPAPKAWPMAWCQVRFEARLTSFRHLGLFPEQAANWEWLARAGAARPGARILNLFGYTGIASLVCAAAGAAVTHLDASRKAVAWAKLNAGLSGLEGAPIRYITEDARAFVRRELRRGALYDGVVLDPPKFGRGPEGEVWRLYEDLPELLRGCARLLAPEAGFLLVNAYSERLTGLALGGLAAETLAGRGGRIDWGELALAEADGRRGVGLSFFARWTAP